MEVEEPSDYEESSEEEHGENGQWTRWETNRMVEAITSNFSKPEKVDWVFVGLCVQKTPQVSLISWLILTCKECKEWYETIVELHSLMPRDPKRRRRRKATEIQRAFSCQVSFIYF